MKSVRSIPARGRNTFILEQLFQMRSPLPLQLRQGFHRAARGANPELLQQASGSSRTRAGQQLPSPPTRSIHTQQRLPHPGTRSSIYANPNRLRAQKRRYASSSTNPLTRTYSSSSSTFTNPFPRTSSNPFIQAFRRRAGRRWYSSSAAGAGAGTAGTQEKLTLSQRLKKLSREYGWTALGVYLLLSALDFPFCFLAVRMLGTDRIGHWEHVVVSYFKGLLKWPVSTQAAEEEIERANDALEKAEKVALENAAGKRILEEQSQEQYAAAELYDHGYKEAEKANSGANASLWTQLALAYAIHKCFIFIRVPLTAAVTPKVVKTLRSWGWNIGKVPKKVKGGSSSSSSASSSTSSSSKTGVNTQGSKVKPDD